MNIDWFDNSGAFVVSPETSSKSLITRRQKLDENFGSMNRENSFHFGKYSLKCLEDILASFAGYTAPPTLATSSSNSERSFNVFSPRKGKSYARVVPCLGKERSPGEVMVPNCFNTARLDPCFEC